MKKPQLSSSGKYLDKWLQRPDLVAAWDSEKNPDLAREWHPDLNAPLTPDDVIVGSTKRVWWMCSQNPSHVWQTVVEKRGKGNRGCPHCAGKTPKIKPEKK